MTTTHLSELINKTFLRNAFTLISGAGLAQLVGVLASPALTRIYAPGDFGVFAVYGSILSLTVVVVCLRYELAITLPDADDEGVSLLLLSVVVAFVVSVICGIVLFIFADTLTNWLSIGDHAYLLIVMPLSLFLAGVYRAGSYWATRQSAYKHLAVSKLGQSVPQTVAQIGLGIFSFGPLGLVLGEVFGRLSGNLVIWSRTTGGFAYRLRAQTYDGLRMVAVKYRRFPIISSWSGVISAAGWVAPALLLASCYGPHTAGLYALVQRVLALPLDLVGQSVLTLYTGEASKLIREDPARLRALFVKLSTGLFLAGLIPVGVFVIYAKTLFVFVFGSDWEQAGYFAQVLSIGLLFRLAISPLTQTLNMLERQDLQFIWDCCRLVAMIIALVIPYTLGLGVSGSLAAYTAVVVVSLLSYSVLALAEINRLPT